MCKAPVWVPAAQSLRACDNCSQCIMNRRYDYAGRMMAEHMVSGETICVTLTFAGDVPESAVMTPRPVQLMMKRLKLKYEVRRAIFGEYGPDTGRVHYHGALFFKDKAPEGIEYGLKQFQWEYWPHGACGITKPNLSRFMYAAKYAVKDLAWGDLAVHKPLVSTRPELGHEWFMRLAREYVEQGLVPRDFQYSFDGVTYTKGKHAGRPVKFTMQGVARDKFMDEFHRLWHEQRPNQPIFYSEPLALYVDRTAQKAQVDSWNGLVENIAAKDKLRGGQWAKPYPVLVEVISSDRPDVVVSRDEFGEWRAHVFDEHGYECGARRLLDEQERSAALNGLVNIPKNGRAAAGYHSNPVPKDDPVRVAREREHMRGLLEKWAADQERAQGYKILRRRRSDGSIPPF